MEEQKMDAGMQEFVTFTVTARDGSLVELAVIDEFDVGFKHYVVAARVVDDAISDEGQYIYRARISGDDFVPEKIVDPEEYEKVVAAYMELEED